MARTSVALLRMQAVDNPTDPRLAALVGELNTIDASLTSYLSANA